MIGTAICGMLLEQRGELPRHEQRALGLVDRRDCRRAGVVLDQGQLAEEVARR